MSARWSRIETEKLIALLKVNRDLWDVNDPAYQVRPRRADTLNDILLKMRHYFPNTRLTVKDIRNKIQSLRTQYRRELRTIEANTKSPSGNERRPSLWFFDKVEFLRPVVELKYNSSATLSKDDVGVSVDGSGGGGDGEHYNMDEMDMDAGTFLSPTVELSRNFAESDRKRSKRIEREDQKEANREKRHRKRIEIANNFLETFGQMVEMDSSDDSDDLDLRSKHCRRRRKIYEESKQEAAIERRHRKKIEVIERRHRDIMEANNRYLDMFQQMVDKM